MTSPSAALQDLLHHLTTASANASLYAPEHPQVNRLCSLALSRAEEMLAAREEISLVLIANQLVFEGAPLAPALTLDRFAQALRTRGIEHLKITRGVRRQEILDLIRTLSRRGEKGASLSTEHVRLGKVEVRYSGKGSAGGESPSSAAGTGLDDLHAHERARLMEIYEASRRQKTLKIVGIFEIVSSFIETVRQVADPLMTLAPLRGKDEYTFTHSTNVCILTLAQAMALGIEESLLQDIGVSALLHDIGKLFIPEEILNKPGPLDKAEWEIMQQHPLLGARYLLKAPGVPRLAVVTAFEHHLKFDLSGYPRVTREWQTSLCGQMTMISDIFDALRTQRPYRPSMETEDVAGVIRDGAGTHLHPHLCRIFLRLLERYDSP